MPAPIFATAAVAVLAYDYTVSLRNRRRFNKLKENNQALRQTHETNRIAFARLLEDLESTRAELTAANRKLTYMLNKLDQHDIPVTEFDVIAMNNIT